MPRTASPTRTPELQHVELERPDTNTRLHLVVVPEFAPTDPRSAIARTPQGSPGIYRVTFVLAIPGQESLRNALEIATIMQAGNSLLRAPSTGITGVKVSATNETDHTDIVFSVNADGALARAQMRVQADSFLAAQAFTYDMVMPVLSWWSFRYDVAIDVAACELVEERTDIQKWIVGVIGKAKVLDNQGNVSKPEYRAVLASYREGVNATNPFYQLLCFYRVAEGTRKLRAHRRAATIAAGGIFREPSDERFPDLEQDLGIADPLVAELFRPYLGRSFGWALDQLRGLCRNAVAHLDPAGDSLVADIYEDVVQSDVAVPILRYIGRRMLRNELLADPDMQNAAPSR